jgi:cysteine-S-conjugate beta-lyase
MKYDFDKVISRANTNCAKWDACKMLFGSDDVIPMWVADMDFPTAQPIVDALTKRAAHPFYGYSMSGPRLSKAFAARVKKKYGWRIEPEWIVYTPGVVSALTAAVKALTHPGDDIILQEPVYYPFFSAVKANGCQIITNKLKFARGRYEMDFPDLASKFESKGMMGGGASRARAVILCNPHNPIGRSWGKEDLQKMGEIVIGHGATVISDEIHCELMFRGYIHTPFGAISKDFEQHSIVCMAPSKTFNLAGLSASSIIIPDKKLRDAFQQAQAGMVHGPNLFGLVAMEAAYKYGDEWLEQLLDYLQGNLDFTLYYFKKNIPKIVPVKPQGTYLLWLDCRALKLDDKGLSDFMKSKAMIGLDDGAMFGAGGSGFERMNIACPRSILAEALSRLAKAVKEL